MYFFGKIGCFAVGQTRRVEKTRRVGIFDSLSPSRLCFRRPRLKNLDSLFTMPSFWLVLYYFAFKRGRLKQG